LTTLVKKGIRFEKERKRRSGHIRSKKEPTCVQNVHKGEEVYSDRSITQTIIGDRGKQAEYGKPGEKEELGDSP